MYIPWLRLNVTSYLDVIWHILGRTKQAGANQSSSHSSWKFSLGWGSQPTGPPAPSEIKASDRPPLWALIIGINDYSNMVKLSGAVPDADAMNHYLLSELKVPPDQITNLRNQEATRAAIIAAFEGMRDNPRIKRQDPILIYYAGHGGEVPTKDEDKTQTLVPVDYVPEKIRPIPDRTVANLINGIANKHGNNITVIFDCCHSGSGTRGEEEESTVRGGELSPNDVPDDLDANIARNVANRDPNTVGTRGIRHAKGFAQKDMNSHILLAACSSRELAREDKSGQDAHGRFTTALLELFKSVTPDQLTYSDVLTKIPRIDGQNPQCEGFYKNRIFFDSKVRPPTRRTYEVNLDGKKYTLQSGRAHGITDGAEFTLYKTKEDVPDAPLGVMIAREFNIKAFTTVLEPVGARPTPFENPAIAIQTKAGASEDLNIHVPLENQYLPVFEAIAREMGGTGPDPCRIKLVDKNEAKLEVVAVGKNQLTFNVLERRAQQHGFTRMPHIVESNVDDLHQILRAAAHYHFHLNLNQENNRIRDQITIDFFPLQEEYDADGDLTYSPAGASLHKDGRIEYEVDEDSKYGMRITNRTPWNLHFACFYFDHADFSITALTEVNTQSQYQKDYPLKQGGTAEIGYGSLGIPPFECDVPEGLELTIGFLKFYFTSEVVDLSHLPQVSPFSGTRGMKQAIVRDKPVWGTVVIPVIQRRAM